MSMANKPYHVHITEKENPITLNLREIWSYRDLILLFTKRNFNLIYKQTVLGPGSSGAMVIVSRAPGSARW